MSDTKPGLFLDKRDDLIAHIEGLQATLTKRNKRIEELVAMLDKPQSESSKEAYAKGYKNGWEEAMSRVHSNIMEAQRQLSAMRMSMYNDALG